MMGKSRATAQDKTKDKTKDKTAEKPEEQKTLLFLYPEASKFGRSIPKEAIYQHAKLSGVLKQDFVQQIAKIEWSYKLSEETTHIHGSEQFKEFQVISLTLKGEALNLKCLEAIDRTIPFPLIFEVRRPQLSLTPGDSPKRAVASIQTIAAYKVIDKGRPKLESAYYLSPRYAPDSPRRPLPQSITLENLYKGLVAELLQSSRQNPAEEGAEKNEKIKGRQSPTTSLHYSGDAAGNLPQDSLELGSRGEGKQAAPGQRIEAPAELTLEEQIARDEARGKLRKELEKLQKRMQRESQFNRKVELNQEIKALKARLKAL